VRLHPLTTALLVANLVLVWILPVLPAQDLPEHLAYIRIFADYGAPDLPFHEFYSLPARFQPYDSVYLLLAAIARVASVLGALRLTMSAYVILMFVGFHLLAQECHGEEPSQPADGGRARPGPWSGALASALIWSPAVAMGFLQYFLCVPIVLITLSLFLRWADDEKATKAAWGVAIGSVIVASVHLVAAGALALFAVLYVVCNWSAPERPQRLTAMGGVLAAMSVTFAAWRLYGDVLGARGHAVDLPGAIRDAQLFEFVNTVFNVTWYDPPVTLNYITWALLGPFSWTGMIAPALALAWLLQSVWRVRKTAPLSAGAQRYKRAAVAFAIVVCLTPWGIQNPSELTYINFRLIALALALTVPLVPEGWFAGAAQRRALVFFCVVTFGNFAGRAYAFGREARVPLGLMERADRDGVLLTVVFHNKSDYFGKGFRLTHFLPMYFTVIDGGINSQFWARYTEHLPIDYLPGKRPAQSDDWSPQNFDASKHLKDARWVLLQQATNDDSPRTRADSAKAKAALDAKAEQVACEGPWCLYRVKSQTEPRPLLRDGAKP
jgi:hypothetical protein